VTIDSVLNWVMPIGIILFFVGAIYLRVQGPADQLLHWIGNGIKNLISSGAESTKEIVIDTEIVYS